MVIHPQVTILLNTTYLMLVLQGHMVVTKVLVAQHLYEHRRKREEKNVKGEQEERSIVNRSLLQNFQLFQDMGFLQDAVYSQVSSRLLDNGRQYVDRNV